MAAVQRLGAEGSASGSGPRACTRVPGYDREHPPSSFCSEPPSEMMPPSSSIPHRPHSYPTRCRKSR